MTFFYLLLSHNSPVWKQKILVKKPEANHLLQ